MSRKILIVFDSRWRFPIISNKTSLLIVQFVHFSNIHTYNFLLCCSMYNSKDFPAIHPVFCDLIPLSRYLSKRCRIFIRITALLKFRSGFCHFSQKFLFIRVRYTLMSIRSTFFRKVFRLFLYLIKITAVSIVNRLQCTLLASCVLFTLFYIM